MPKSRSPWNNSLDAVKEVGGADTFCECIEHFVPNLCHMAHLSFGRHAILLAEAIAIRRFAALGKLASHSVKKILLED